MVMIAMAVFHLTWSGPTYFIKRFMSSPTKRQGLIYRENMDVEGVFVISSIPTAVISHNSEANPWHHHPQMMAV